MKRKVKALSNVECTYSHFVYRAFLLTLLLIKLIGLPSCTVYLLRTSFCDHMQASFTLKFISL